MFILQNWCETVLSDSYDSFVGENVNNFLWRYKLVIIDKSQNSSATISATLSINNIFAQGVVKAKVELMWILIVNIFIFKIIFLAIDFVSSAWSIGFFIPATTANDLRLRKISIPDLIHYIIFLS